MGRWLLVADYDDANGRMHDDYHGHVVMDSTVMVIGLEFFSFVRVLALTLISLLPSFLIL